MRIGRKQYHVEWSHLAFLTAMAFIVIAYILNVRAVSTNLNNTMFVQPVAIIAISLYLFIAYHCFHAVGEPGEPVLPAVEEEPAEEPIETARVVGMMAALGIYAFTLNFLGFDIATWLFALASMFICGERGILRLIVFPLLLAVAIVFAFRFLIPFPMPTTIL